MTDTNLNEIFEANKDKGKDEIIMALHTQGGLNIMQAVREYNKLAKDAGLILGAKERTEKVNEILNSFDEAMLQDNESRKEIIERIADEFDVSTVTAYQHVKKYCEENDIELPTVQRTSLEDMVAFVKDKLDEKMERSEVVKALQDEMGYTANSAASAFSRATRELGLSTGRAGPKADISDVVAFMRENRALPRKAAVAKMVEELGYAESTANAFYTYQSMAEEWARQETENVA